MKFFNRGHNNALWMVGLCAILVLLFNTAGSKTMAQSPLPLIPAPRSWQPSSGSFLKKDLESSPLIQRLDAPDDLPSPAGEIIEPGLVDESYRLVIRPDGMELSARSRSGLFRGTQTVQQLLDATGDSIPCGIIEDEPGFRWRGMLLDCCRHFMPMDVIKETIDQLAYHKFNVLHWHLTEDQGWRLEVPGYPLLTEVSAWREEWDGSRYGGYYTSEEVREVVAYAAARFITVVPEIELPGHSVAALAAYPELSCNGTPLKVETQWGVFQDVYCAGNDQTFKFLEDVLTHTMELFPSHYIHIGGDECPKDRWRACPKCQQRIADENLEGEHELQSWFIRRIEKFLMQNNRRIIGWDEILEGGLAPAATVQSWRGVRGAIAAARQGHDAIVSPTTHCYFDADVATLDIRQVYTFNPRPEKLSAAENEHILGGEMNLWSEYIPPERLQSMVFPRMTAMAECLWTDNDDRSFPEFLERLRPHVAMLEAAGVNVGPTDQPINYQADFDEDTGSTVVKFSLDSKLVEAMDGHSVRLHQRVLPKTEAPGYRPDWRVEDMVLPPVRVTDPAVPDNLKLEWTGGEAEAHIMLVQLFIDGLAYGTPTVVERSHHLALDKQPDLTHQPSSRYPGGGPSGLCNGLFGTRNFRDGFWSGYEGNNLDAMVNLGKTTEIRKISIRFYQGATAWVFLPETVEFLASEDGTNWNSIAIVEHGVSPFIQDRVIHEFVVDGLNLKTNHVRIIGKNRSVCPDWHPGAGQPCWVFADEIVIQ